MEYFDYEALTEYNGGRTPTGIVTNDWSTRYFRRALYERAMSVFEFRLPEEWNKQYFKNVLFRLGYIAVIPTAKYGVIPQICTLRGYGLYLQPTEVVVSQPLVQYEGRIDIDCGLIKLTPSYMGIWEIIDHYASMLSNIYTSTNVAITNSRLAFLLAAKNKATAEALKVGLEKIYSGEPVVILDKLIKEGLDEGEPLISESFDVKEHYVVDKLLMDTATILSQFDREIGIEAVDEKKERMLTDEIATQNSGTNARVTTWLECLDESTKKVNDLFGLDVRITKRGGDENAEADNDRNV